MPPPPRTRLWRKRLTRAILCLLLGAVTTVGVAWALSVPDYAARDRTFEVVDPVRWPVPAPGSWPSPDAWLMTHEPRTVYAKRVDFGLTLTIETVAMVEDNQRGWRQDLYSCGWPLPAVKGWYLCEPTAQGWSESNWYLLEIDGERRIPTLPILPGFLLDTLFYAAPWWLILITPGAIRRLRRRRRGRCIHCGYDLTGLRRDDNTTPTCPECGA